MFKFIHFGQDLYGIQEGETLAVGTFHEAISYMMEVLGVEQREVALAVELFNSEGHNTADFGICQTLIFTDYREYAITHPVFAQTYAA